MMSPTIGRRVWYWPSDYDTNPERSTIPMRQSDPAQAFDAGVVFVWSDRMVNLSVADHAGKVFARPSVVLVQEGDALPVGQSYATWMPYQTGQAKKQAAEPETPLPSIHPYPAFKPAART